jgi:hypothetical protein
MAMAAARRALLNHLRVPVARPATAAAVAAAGSVPVARLLSSTTEVEKGSFLDKGEVADRVVSVIKNFQKIEPSKVTAKQCARVARTFGRWIRISYRLDMYLGFLAPIAVCLLRELDLPGRFGHKVGGFSEFCAVQGVALTNRPFFWRFELRRERAEGTVAFLLFYSPLHKIVKKIHTETSD